MSGRCLAVLSLSVNLIDFDPDIIDVIVSFIGVAAKYAFYIGILARLAKMAVNAGTGKERFF